MRIAVVTIAALLALVSPASGARTTFPAANGALVYTEQHVMRSRFETPFRYLCAARVGSRAHTALPDRRSWRDQPAYAPDGRRIAYVRKVVGGPFGTLAIYGPDRAERPVFGVALAAAWPTWFPANDRLAFSSTGGAAWGGNIDIYAASDTGGGFTRLTTGEGEDTMPAISPDGTRIAYVYAVGRRSELWTMNSDGTGHAPLVRTLETVVSPSWSPDGENLIFGGSPHSPELGVSTDAYRVDADGRGLSRLSPIGGERDPEYSPDGRLVAFARGTAVWTRELVSGVERIVVSAPIELGQPTWQPLTAGSEAPQGRELCAIKGTRANETIQGTPGEDVIFGGAGRDRIQALAGNDLIFDDGGGVIDAGRGNDTVFIEGVPDGSGNGDVLASRAPPMIVNGQAGDDAIYGSNEGDRLDGGDGRDAMYGRRGNDRLAGGSHGDILIGGAGRDLVVGGGGHDVLRGFGLDPAARLAGMGDTLRGGAGDDYLAGGRGQDLLNGQGGNDVLVSRDGYVDRVLGGLGLDRAWVDFRDLLRGVESCPKRSVPPAPGPRAARDSPAATPSPRCRPRR